MYRCEADIGMSSRLIHSVIVRKGATGLPTRAPRGTETPFFLVVPAAAALVSRYVRVGRAG
eukprot:1762359-Rhodomonas_salina.1